MPSESATSVQTPQNHATELFLQGQLIEASDCLSEAIRHSESPDLWNDWAVVQLSLAEQAFRRARRPATATLVCQELLPLGYLYAQRIGPQLEIVNAPINSVNSFFLHPAHSAEYRRIGLLKL